MSDIGARIREERERLGMNQTEFGRFGGVQKNAQHNYESGVRNAGSDYLAAIASMGADVTYILTGARIDDPAELRFASFETRMGMARPAEPKPVPGDIEVGGVDYAFIRRFEVQASAGHGHVVESEDVSGGVALTRQFLLKHGLSADLSGLVEAHGDSMEPLITDGALMLINFAVDQVKDDTIYIVRHGDELLVKRVMVAQRDAVGTPLEIRLISENPAYLPVEIEGFGLRDFQAIGRVVTIIRDL